MTWCTKRHSGGSPTRSGGTSMLGGTRGRPTSWTSRRPSITAGRSSRRRRSGRVATRDGRDLPGTYSRRHGGARGGRVRDGRYDRSDDQRSPSLVGTGATSYTCTAGTARPAPAEDVTSAPSSIPGDAHGHDASQRDDQCRSTSNFKRARTRSPWASGPVSCTGYSTSFTGCTGGQASMAGHARPAGRARARRVALSVSLALDMTLRAQANASRARRHRPSKHPAQLRWAASPPSPSCRASRSGAF